MVARSFSHRRWLTSVSHSEAWSDLLRCNPVLRSTWPLQTLTQRFLTGQATPPRSSRAVGAANRAGALARLDRSGSSPEASQSEINFGWLGAWPFPQECAQFFQARASIRNRMLWNVLADPLYGSRVHWAHPSLINMFWLGAWHFP